MKSLVAGLMVLPFRVRFSTGVGNLRSFTGKTLAMADLGPKRNSQQFRRYHPRPINDRMWFGKIVASYKFTSGGSAAISTATFATSSAAMT